MDNKATGTSNDESRKEAKTSYVSDEEVRMAIQQNYGEEIYIAAIDWEAIIEKETNQNGTTSTGGGTKRKIRVGSKTSKALNSLLIDPLVTVGAKPEKGKFKKAREDKKTRKIEQKQKEQQKEM